MATRVLGENELLPSKIGVKKFGICEMCYRLFLYYPSDKVSGKHCSNKCARESPDFRSKLSSANTGRKATNEARLHMSKSHIGKFVGDKSPSWKGGNIGYMAMHDWVRETFGSPSKCEHCETERAAKFEWANISGEYKRDRSDWIRLCKKCHQRFDNIGEKASKTYLERKSNGEFELRDVGNGRRRWCKPIDNKEKRPKGRPKKHESAKTA